MRKSLIGLAAFGAIAAVVYGNYRRTYPKPEALGDTAYEVEVKRLYLHSGDRLLYGELLLPKGLSGALPTVICSHGINGSYRYFRNYAGMSLAMSGFAVYCFDFYGGSDRSRSGGRMTDMTVFSERDDLNAVIDGIRMLDTTDRERLFLLGESQGGFVAAITAARRAQDIRGLIEYNPAFCIPDDAQLRFNLEEDIPEQYVQVSCVLAHDYAAEMLDFDVYEEITGYKGPVLIVHGESDEIVDISYSEKAAEVYDHAKLVRLPGDVHGLTADGKRKAAKWTYAFLQEIMKEK
jgi:pimeloyl-ACP methyl ester carboxylesterase